MHCRHGVNNAEGISTNFNAILVCVDAVKPALKSEALAWRFTGDATDKKSTFDRIDLMYKFHGRASGAWLTYF